MTLSTSAPETRTNDRETLLRFMGDMIAGWRMGLEAYEHAIDMVEAPDDRSKLGEHKAEVAHDFEVLRSQLRMLGGTPSVAKNLAAGVGARLQSLVTSAAGTREGYASALVLGQLAAGELTGLLQLRVLQDVGGRANETQLTQFAERAIEASEKRKEWLETRAVALAVERVTVPRPTA